MKNEMLQIDDKKKMNLALSASINELPFSARLRASEKNLTATERKVGEYFLNNPNAIFSSISEVVEDGALGYGTVIRFCQKIGCVGFQEFKMLLAQERGTLKNRTTNTKSNNITEYTQKIITDLMNTEKLCDPAMLSMIAKVINNARRVLITGIAGSAPLAIGLDYHLSRIGINCSAVCDGYNLAIRAATLNSEDVFFAISFSGATKDLLAAAKTAKNNGTKNISLTNFIHAPLVELSNYNLFSSTSRDPLSCEIFSNCAATYVLDVLFSYIYNIREDAKATVEKTFAAISDKRI